MTYPECCRIAPCVWLAVFLILPICGCGSSSDTSIDNPSTSSSADEDTPAAADDSAPTQDPAPTDTPASDPAPPAQSNIGTSTAAPEGDIPSGGVQLSGRVVFDGPVPERRVVNMKKDRDCIKLHGGETVLDEAVLVAEDGGVKNAFIYVRRGAPDGEYPMPEQPARLDQKNCMYRPRVQGVRVGQTLLVANNDPLTHNVRSFPIRSRPFNFGQKPESEPRERIFERAEREVEVQCDIHPWMHAYLFVMDHPFFSVSTDDGAYAIAGLPPGEYTLEAWHEKLGKQRQTVTLGSDDVTGVNFTYKP